MDQQYDDGFRRGYQQGFQQGFNQGNAQPPQYNPGGKGVFDDGPYGKSRGVAALLALLLGSLGVQYFYLGKIGGGLIAILLCIVTCGLFYVLFIVQGVMMLTMSQEDFDRKFVLSTSTFPLF